MKTKTIFLIVLSVVWILVSIACMGSSTPPPQVTQEEKTLAINAIEEQKGVIDADFGQEGRTLSLALIVANGTTISQAKELGANFVRLVKSFSKDESPKNEIGSGIYDYLIGVYYPNRTEVVMGAKASIARSITW